MWVWSTAGLLRSHITKEEAVKQTVVLKKHLLLCKHACQ